MQSLVQENLVGLYHPCYRVGLLLRYAINTYSVNNRPLITQYQYDVSLISLTRLETRRKHLEMIRTREVEE
jgi:hypothetical protein